MQLDAIVLIKCAEELEITYFNLLKSFKGEWYDEVHDSYGNYVKTVRNNANKLTDISKKADDKCSDFNSLKVEIAIDEAANICNEAMSLCNSAEE